MFVLWLFDLTKLGVGIWWWCWWEQGDRGVAHCQTWACCWLHRVHIGVDVILHPVEFNKTAEAPLLLGFQADDTGCYFWSRDRFVKNAPSVGDQHRPPGIPSLCYGNFTVTMFTVDTHFWVHFLLESVKLFLVEIYQ